jgi:hypothetical protein
MPKQRGELGVVATHGGGALEAAAGISLARQRTKIGLFRHFAPD